MTARNQRSLTAAIVAQERAVAEADRRLSSRLVIVTDTLRNKRSPLRSVVWNVGSLAAAWFFMRGRHRRLATQVRAGSGSRLATLLNVVLPLLAPVVGVRVATVLSALAAVQATSAAARAPALTQAVDLARYAGTWFEIARLPAHHERPCAGDVTATYVLDRDHVDVINQCRRANGRLDIARGRARVIDPVSRAKLKVTFAPPFLQWLPGAWADYWILDVSPDYRRALVGTPNRKSLWVLAREASLPEEEYRAMLLQATALGFETRRVRRTAHRSVL